MADLIDRQAAIDALNSLCDIVCQYSKKQRSVMCGACPLGSAFDTIEELPSADAVVRCGECKRMERWYNLCLCQKWSRRGVEVKENDYCSYGERKDG